MKFPPDDTASGKREPIASTNDAHCLRSRRARVLTNTRECRRCNTKQTRPWLLSQKRRPRQAATVHWRLSCATIVVLHATKHRKCDSGTSLRWRVHQLGMLSHRRERRVSWGWLGKGICPDPRARTVGLLPHRDRIAQRIDPHHRREGRVVIGLKQRRVNPARAGSESLSPDACHCAVGLLPDCHRNTTRRHGNPWKVGATSVVVFE